ncbi:MAG: hypothetical protein M5U32_15065 [Myxococcota bacterium]|nr:hypothetical protein [Myxococcota bacterium]
MIRREDDQRVVVPAALAQRVEQPADVVIGPGDLRVVGVAQGLEIALVELPLRGERLKLHHVVVLTADARSGAVREAEALVLDEIKVRIEVVDEEEPRIRFTRERVEARNCLVRQLLGRNEGVSARKALVPALEAAVESPLLAEEEMGDEARGGIAALAQTLSERRHTIGKAPRFEADAERRRMVPGHHAGHRGERPGRRAACLQEHARVERQLVEARRERARAPADSEAVEAQRVDEDQQDRSAARRAGPWLEARPDRTACVCRRVRVLEQRLWPTARAERRCEQQRCTEHHAEGPRVRGRPQDRSPRFHAHRHLLNRRA